MTTGPVPGTKLLAGRCPYCRRQVFQVRDAAAGRLVILEPTEVNGLVANGTGGNPSVVEGWTAEGQAAHVNPDATSAGPRLTVYRDHARVCWQAARAGRRPVDQDPERKACTGCGAPMLWIRTVDGKRVPLDPEPHHGPLYATGEPVPEGFHVVRGYGLDGAVRAILEGNAAGLFGELPKGDRATLYVTHFATCPERDSFKRRTPGGRRGERRT